MIHRILKSKDFGALWRQSSKFIGQSQAELGHARHSFLSIENKIKVKELRAPSLGSRPGFNSAEHSWMRSNHTTGEGGKVDTFSLLEFEDELSSRLREMVKNKKMQDWEQAEVELFLAEIGMSRIVDGVNL